MMSPKLGNRSLTLKKETPITCLKIT